MKPKLSDDKDFYDIFLANVLLNYTNVNGKYTNEINVDAKYGLGAVFEKGESINVDSNTGTYQALSIDFGGKSIFKARENVDVELSLDNEYSLNGLNKDIYGVYRDFIKDSSNYKDNINDYAKDKYDINKQNDIREKKDTIKRLTGGKLSTKEELANAIHSLTVKPKITTKFSYANGRLEVRPWIGAEFNLENKPTTTNGTQSSSSTTENKDFVLRKIVGKGTDIYCINNLREK
ncbi:hypothetical protein [Streptobacillus moniliformis]|nr:hypothetical protein [Streptobacillus moniliformis]QXW65066.1 hypothetical protein KX935_04255 [Streptobacillus moniliformis]